MSLSRARIILAAMPLSLLLASIAHGPIKAWPMTVLLTRQCCKQDIEAIKRALGNSALSQLNISVWVDTSFGGKQEMNAGALPCLEQKENARPACTIYVTEKLLASLPEDERMAVLGHELGHLANPENVRNSANGRELENEYFADSFSLDVLDKVGMDKGALLRVMRKLLRNTPFLTPDGMGSFRKRISRVQRLLAKENKERAH